jgi:hypothetical protein
MKNSCYCRALCTKLQMELCAPFPVFLTSTKRLFSASFRAEYEQFVSGSRPIQDTDFTFIKQSELYRFIYMNKTAFKRSFNLFHVFGY